jgi:hypothetical protein
MSAAVESFDRSQTRIAYGAWFFRVLTWDAALPFLIAMTPIVLERLFPHRRGFIEMAAVTVPTMAFFIRIYIGKKHIFENGCSPRFRRFQCGAFCLAILPLVLIECILTLAVLMPLNPQAPPNGPRFSQVSWILLVLYMPIYLPLMTLAMYPGRYVRIIEPTDDVMSLGE